MRIRLGNVWDLVWQNGPGYLVIGLTIVTALWWRLGTLLGGFSQLELVARANASSLANLANNPLFLPHKAIQYVFIYLGHSGAFWMRSASALWAVVILALFYQVMLHWYTRRVALFGSFLLLTSAWFLHFARLGTPEVMYGLSIGLVWAGLRLRSVRTPRIRSTLASLVIILSCLYVPGMIWLLLITAIWQRRLIWRELSSLPVKLRIIGTLVGIIAVLPLLRGFMLHPALALDWLMVPHHWTPGLLWSNLWHIPVWLALRGPLLPARWLGRLPLLDIFSLVMLGLGGFVLASYRKLDRVQILVFIAIVAFGLTVLGGWPALFLATPVIFLIIASGIALLLQQWFTVFPRNTVARMTGVLVICLLVGLSGYYNLRHYFIAWPRSDQTRAIFHYHG